MRHFLWPVPLLVILAGSPALADESPNATSTFQVQLHGDTHESLIDQILAAGHDQLAPACVAYPGASIRVFTPLASGDYTDVPCSTILDGGESLGQTSEALTSGGERIGQIQQPFSLVGLACSALLLGATLAWNWPRGQEGCNNPRAENQEACRWATSVGGGGLGLLCALI